MSLTLRLEPVHKGLVLVVQLQLPQLRRVHLVHPARLLVAGGRATGRRGVVCERSKGKLTSTVIAKRIRPAIPFHVKRIGIVQNGEWVVIVGFFWR